MRPGRAFTVAELLVAMTISASVMAGAVAAIGVGGQSFRAATEGLQSAQAMDGLARMTADIEQAIYFDERTATAVGFYVSDRTGDGAPDHLRYAWGGTAGDAVTLSMNGSTASPILEGVEDLSLRYVFADVTGQAEWAAPPVVDELIFERTYSGAPAATFNVDDGASIAAIFQPIAPDGAATYTITRVVIPMAEAPSWADDAIVSIHRVDMTRGVPTGNALASRNIDKQDFPEGTEPFEIVFDTSATFSDGEYVAVVVASDKRMPSVDIPLEASPAFLSDGWVATTSSGGPWTVNGTRDMPIKVYAQAADR